MELSIVAKMLMPAAHQHQRPAGDLEEVVAVGAEDAIRARVAHQPIVALVAVEPVVADPTGDAVVADRAADRVVSAAAADRVVAGAAVDEHRCDDAGIDVHLVVAAASLDGERGDVAVEVSGLRAVLVHGDQGAVLRDADDVGIVAAEDLQRLSAG
jgi:hypothetical protein